MRQIRRGVFETNSSSTHSITICPQETYDKWLNGTALYDDLNNDFIEAEELTPYDYEQAGQQYEKYKGKYYKNWDELSEAERKDYTSAYVLKNKNHYGQDLLTYADWCVRHGDLAKYSERYTTQHGDTIVVFGYYGYD